MHGPGFALGCLVGLVGLLVCSVRGLGGLVQGDWERRVSETEGGVRAVLM